MLPTIHFSLVFHVYPSVEECRNIIVQFGVREVTAVQVARVLGMMARTHSGLTDGISLQVSQVFCSTGYGKHVASSRIKYSYVLQSISAPGSGIWSDGKDKNDGVQAHTWNVEVLIDVVKELVSCAQILASVLC